MSAYPYALCYCALSVVFSLLNVEVARFLPSSHLILAVRFAAAAPPLIVTTIPADGCRVDSSVVTTPCITLQYPSCRRYRPRSAESSATRP